MTCIIPVPFCGIPSFVARQTALMGLGSHTRLASHSTIIVGGFVSRPLPTKTAYTLHTNIRQDVEPLGDEMYITEGTIFRFSSDESAQEMPSEFIFLFPTTLCKRQGDVV
jgi:hypothetical protein